MRFLLGLVVFCSLVGINSIVPLGIVNSSAQPATTESSPPSGQPTAPAPQPGAASGAQAAILGDAAQAYSRPVIWGAVIAGIIIVGGIVLLYLAARAGADPLILRLGPSFFFWLSMMYTALLLLMATLYLLCSPDPKPTLLAGVLPIAVPWFGALGAVAISLEGVFLWNNQWDRKYNYWHIGRPLFGAVLGIVAFFLFVVIGAAAGTAPKFLDVGSAPPKDLIIFYVLAFLVGYREETFRELIKRATDLVLKPGTQAPAAPAVAFKVAGAVPLEIRCPDATAPATSRVTVEVQNIGNAPLIGPAVTATPIAPTPAGTFAMANDLVTGGGDLAPGQSRTVDVTFTPAAAGNFSGTLTVTATNLATPKTIRIVGRMP